MVQAADKAAGDVVGRAAEDHHGLLALGLGQRKGPGQQRLADAPALKGGGHAEGAEAHGGNALPLFIGERSPGGHQAACQLAVPLGDQIQPGQKVRVIPENVHQIVLGAAGDVLVVKGGPGQLFHGGIVLGAFRADDQMTGHCASSFFGVWLDKKQSAASARYRVSSARRWGWASQMLRARNSGA